MFNKEGNEFRCNHCKSDRMGSRLDKWPPKASATN